MKAFKGFNVNESGQLVCRGMIYEPGKTYKYKGQIELCSCGYHACEKFEDVFRYYPYEKGKTRYYKVECNGEIIRSSEDTKFVCSEITLLEELHGWWEEYDYVYSFHEGFAAVKLNGKYNFINTEGNLLSNQWFDLGWDFYGGFAQVRLNGKSNYINTEGKFLSNQWFDDVNYFSPVFAKVKLNDTEYKLDKQWFAQVKLNGKYNFINTAGKLLSNQCFVDAGDFLGGFAMVKLNDTEYKLDTEGNLRIIRQESPLL